MGMGRNVPWCTVHCRLSVAFSLCSSPRTGICRHFLIIPCFLRSLHLPPAFWKNIYFLLQIRAFLSANMYGYDFLSLPSLSPYFQTCHCHCPLAPFCHPQVLRQMFQSLSLVPRDWFQILPNGSWVLLWNSSVLPSGIQESLEYYFLIFLIFLCQQSHVSYAQVLLGSHDCLLPGCPSQLSAWYWCESCPFAAWKLYILSSVISLIMQNDEDYKKQYLENNRKNSL